MDHGPSEHMRYPPFRVVVAAALIIASTVFLQGCAMITEMANTPAYDDGAYSGVSAPQDPYYRGAASDASAPGIR